MTRPNTSGNNRLGKKPRTKYVWLSNEDSYAEELTEANKHLEMVKLRLNALAAQPGSAGATRAAVDLAEAQERKRKAEEALRANAVKYVFRALGSKSYEKLVNEHPVLPEQYEELKANGVENPEQFAWNPMTFPNALIASSMIEPANCYQDPESQAEIILELESDDWNNAELATLFEAALEVNTSRRVVQLGNG